MAFLLTLFLTGVVLNVIGSAMERRERAERERRWRDRHAGDPPEGSR